MLSYIPFVGGTLVSTLRGGDEISQTTLANFFALHVAILPLSLLFFSVWHIWIVRKAGGLILDKTVANGENLKVKSNPHLIVREIATALMLIGVVTIFSIFVNAPLNDPANPAMSPNLAKGAWYFLGLQELLLHFHPSFAICVIPFFIGSLLVALPFFEDHVLPGGKWFGGEKGIKTFGLTFLLGTILTFGLVTLDDLILRSNQIGHGNADLYTRGWVPFLILTFCCVGLYLILLKRFKVKKPEITMVLFTLLSSSLITMTVIGLFFRGPGMQLIFPWNW